MAIAPLSLISVLLHAWVGWRVVPALASVAAFPSKLGVTKLGVKTRGQGQN